MIEERIPKVLHYCWFGRGQKNQTIQKCMRSWAEYCSEYQLIEWNEDNFDIGAAPAYVREAYEAKKWAFVTDYVRLWVLFNYGGVYVDTDVEIVKPIDDFLKWSGFSGFESSNVVPTGIMAAVKGNSMISFWLSEYDEKHFLLEDGSYNTETNTIAISRMMVSQGLTLDNTFQVVNNFAFYPNDWFCPKDWETGEIRSTGNTYAIHHFTMTWIDKEEQQRVNSKRKKYSFYFLRNRILQLIVGKKNFERLKSLRHRQ